MISYFFSSTMSCILHSPWYLQYAFNTQNLTRSREKTSETPCHHVTSPLGPAPATHVQTRTVTKLSHPRSALGEAWLNQIHVAGRFRSNFWTQMPSAQNLCTSSNCEHLASCQWVGALAAIVEHSTKNAEVKQGHAPRLNKSRRAKLYMPHWSALFL